MNPEVQVNFEQAILTSFPSWNSMEMGVTTKLSLIFSVIKKAQLPLESLEDHDRMTWIF